MYANPAAWAKMQQHCIAINGSFFNTHRMVMQYFRNAYFPFPNTGDLASPALPINEPAVEALLNEPTLS